MANLKKAVTESQSSQSSPRLPKQPITDPIIPIKKTSSSQHISQIAPKHQSTENQKEPTSKGANVFKLAKTANGQTVFSLSKPFDVAQILQIHSSGR